MNNLNKLIVMLTHNDQTVANALDVFKDCADLPVENWGFKDVGLPVEKMKNLVSAMKEMRKQTFLEVVTYSEEDCLRGAKLAVECEFDFLMGTLYYDQVWDFLKNKKIHYCPFVGVVEGSPSVLRGTLDSMLAQSRFFAEKGIYGVDLLGYRYTDGDPGKLSATYIKTSTIPTVLAGSIASRERILNVLKMNPKYFTMGSALFSRNFVKNGTIRENLVEVCKILS